MNLLREDPLFAALLAAFVLATATAAFALGALRLLRRRPAALRNHLAFAAVLLMLLGPIAHVASLPLGLGVKLLPAAAPQETATSTLPQTEAAAQSEGDAQEFELTAPPAVGIQTDAPPPSPGAPPSKPAVTSAFAWPSAGALLLAVWLLFATVRLLLDLSRSRRLQRSARQLPLAGPALQQLFATAAATVGLHRIPPLHEGDGVPCPATIGVLSARIVVPHDLLDRHGAAEAAAMLRHECAHVAAGHHHQGLAVLLLRATFGWHPLAQRLLERLAAAQEDVADNAAAAAGDQVAYARSLLALAERAERSHPHPLMLSALGRSPLGDRVRRLLAEEIEPMTPLPLRTRLSTTATIALLLAAAATVRIAAQDPAQDPAPARVHPDSGAAYLPLVQGSSWKWRVSRHSDDSQSVSEVVAWDYGEVPSEAGPCHQLLLTSSDQADVNADYWSADATGIYEYDHRYLASIRGPGRTRTRLVPAPLGVETRWTWTYQLSYQTEGEVERDPEHDKVSCVGELLAMSEEVTVPAGVFRAAHVRLTSTCAWWQQPQVRDLWFARDVGLVKEALSGGGGAMQRELVEHVAGKAPAAESDAVIVRKLKVDWRARGAAPQLAWLPRDEAACYLRGRFATVTFAAGTDQEVRAAFFVDAGRLREIDRDERGFWQDCWQQMQAPPPVRAKLEQKAQSHDDIAHGMEFSFLAALYGQVEAFRSGCTALTSIGSNSVRDMRNGRSTHTELWHCRDAAGVEKDLEASFVVAGGQLTLVTTKLGPSTRDRAPQRGR